MRTTLAIDDDILAVAKQLAERESKSMGEVIPALARQGLNKSSRAIRPVRNGVALLPARKGAKAVTIELVTRLRDEQA